MRELLLKLDKDSVLLLFRLQPIKLRWVINICLTTLVWFIALIKHQGQYRMTVFIVLHFVKKFVWYRSVYTKYSYYRDLFYSGTALHLCDCHRHRWVCYIDTTKITVGGMSYLILSILYDYFVIYIIFYLKQSHTFLFWKIPNLFICGIFEHNLFAADKSIHNLLFLIIYNKYRNQFPFIKPTDHWKTGLYQESDNRCEGDCDSDLNSLASVILGNTLL